MIFCITSVILKMYISVHVHTVIFYFLLSYNCKSPTGLMFYCLSYSTKNKYSIISTSLPHMPLSELENSCNRFGQKKLRIKLHIM